MMHTIERADTIIHEPQAFKKIRIRWKEVNSMAGVGLDPDEQKIPDIIWSDVGGQENIAEGFYRFNTQIIDATAPHVTDYKINANFYHGSQRSQALERTFAYLKKNYPDILRICDGKFADVSNTAEKIAEAIFGKLDADAVLLNPYLGFDAIKPFTLWKNKAVILCINTSNPSADSIQGLPLDSGEPLWKHVLKVSMSEWNTYGNILPVLSATHPEHLVAIRDIVGNTPILLAGVGIQGGSLMKSVPLCLDSQGFGLLVSASRSILYAPPRPGEHFASASQRAVMELKDAINACKPSGISSL